MAEYKVATTEELTAGEMKQVQAGSTPVLLVHLQDGFHAVGALCTHYEAPLAAGALCDDRVICPWHHACFSARTGELLEPPGFDALPVYPVRVVEGDVWVEIPEKSAEIPTPGRNSKDLRTCIVMGGGCAGAYAVEALRAYGFGGQIIWITGEEFPPVDRPLLSKGFLSGEATEEWLVLRNSAFYETRDIEVQAGRRVVDLDASQKRLSLDDGRVLHYDTAIVATGAVARQIPVPGTALQGVFSLHSLEDSRQVRAAAESAHRVVVVGAGFIGMEVAQSLRKHQLEVTVVAPEVIPFQRILGPEIGGLVRAIHEENGVHFSLGHTVAAFEGEQRVRQVRLEDGTLLEADLVVVGIGVQPQTGFVRGVEKQPDGSLAVNERMRVTDDLYAVGDLARFPDWRSGQPIRIEHWRVAAQHGRIAGANVAGQDLSYRGVPYFWTRQFGQTLHYIGHAEDWDEVRISGNLKAREFIAYYCQGGKVHAIAGMEREQELARLEEKMRSKGLLEEDDLHEG